MTNTLAGGKTTTSKYDVLGRSAAELREWMIALDEPAYRSTQLYHALYVERCFDFEAMTNLPAALRARLASQACIGLPQITRRYQSSDGAVRFLLSLPEVTGQTGAARVETVFMPSEGRQTICISSQAGCAVDCQFCVTAQLGLIRNLTAAEIVGQVLLALEDQKHSLAPRTNVVLMGQGEPLLNYEATMAAVRLMLDRNGMGLAARHVTLSTSGIVPGIERLGQEEVRPKLAISLNASSNEQRDRLMPINRKYPLEMLIDACRRYPLRPSERLTFEYVLLGDTNDSPADAWRVARLLSGLRAKVNLIPWNAGPLPYHTPDSAHVQEFRRILGERDIPSFVRISRGQDIAAACGQLALIETASSTPDIGIANG